MQFPKDTLVCRAWYTGKPMCMFVCKPRSLETSQSAVASKCVVRVWVCVSVYAFCRLWLWLETLLIEGFGLTIDVCYFVFEPNVVKGQLLALECSLSRHNVDGLLCVWMFCNFKTRLRGIISLRPDWVKFKIVVTVMNNNTVPSPARQLSWSGLMVPTV